MIDDMRPWQTSVAFTKLSVRPPLHVGQANVLRLTPVAELRAGSARRPPHGTTAAAPDGAAGRSEMQPA